MIFPSTICCPVVIFMAGKLWVQNTTSAANYENGISQADRCKSTSSYPSSPVLQTSQVFLLYIPVELLRDYSWVQTWVCFYLSAGTSEISQFILLFFLFTAWLWKRQYPLCSLQVSLVERDCSNGKQGQVALSNTFICLQFKRVLQLCLKYFSTTAPLSAFFWCHQGHHSISLAWWCLPFVQTLLWMSLFRQ